MIISRIFIFVILLLCLCSTSSAFEDTFQYYPLGGFTTNDVWFAYDNGAKHSNTIISDGNATYSRSIQVYSYGTYPNDGTGYVINANPFSTNYIGFNVRSVWANAGGLNNGWARVQLLDSDFVVLMTENLASGNNHNPPWPKSGWYEYIRSGTENH